MSYLSKKNETCSCLVTDTTALFHVRSAPVVIVHLTVTVVASRADSQTGT